MPAVHEVVEYVRIASAETVLPSELMVAVLSALDLT